MKKKLVAHLAREQEKKGARKKKTKQKGGRGSKVQTKDNTQQVQNAKWGRDLSVV